MPVKPGTHRDAPAKSIETEVKIELADLPKVRDRLVRLGFPDPNRLELSRITGSSTSRTDPWPGGANS